jgi:hypothetical protein
MELMMVQQHKNINLIALISIALFLQGCSGNTGNPTFEQIHSGTDGLVMDFDLRTTPVDTLEESTFYTTLKLHNAGAEDINDGVLKIVSDDYISLEENRNIILTAE